MSLPPHEIPLGAIRFNSQSQRLEYWNGSIWMQINTFSPVLGESGAQGGSSSVTLSTAQLPSHTHGDGSLAANNVSITGNVTKISECYNVAGGATGVFSKYNTGNSPVTGSASNSPTAGFSMDASHSHPVSGTTGPTGSGSSHENRPPYYALCYIMKT